MGSLPSVVPENSLAGGNQQNNRPGIAPDGLHYLAWPGDPVWEIAGGMIAHETHKVTGDLKVIQTGYASLKALVDFFSRKGNTQQNGLTTFGFEGDWLGVEGCYPQRSRAWSLPNASLPGCLLSNMSSATAQVVATTQLSEMAAALGNSADEATYAALAAKLRIAYHRAFYNASAGQYKGNGTHVSQFANLMPLALNITPPALVQSVLAKLIVSIRNGASGTCASAPCIGTGFWGTRFMLQTLTQYGEHALAMELATKTKQPSWGFMVTSNRSVGTLWEAWDGGSLDHIALGGGIGEWLYSAAGYSRDPWTGRVTLKATEPALAGAASVSRHVSGEGTTGWSWRHDLAHGTFEANVSVPLGCRVEVWLEPPRRQQSDDAAARLVVREAGAVVWSEVHRGGGGSVALDGRAEDGRAVMSLGSGEFRLSAALV